MQQKSIQLPKLPASREGFHLGSKVLQESHANNVIGIPRNPLLPAQRGSIWLVKSADSQTRQDFNPTCASKLLYDFGKIT